MFTRPVSFLLFPLKNMIKGCMRENSPKIHPPPQWSRAIRNPQTVSPWSGHIFPNSPRGRTGVSVAESRNELPGVSSRLVIWHPDKLPVPFHPLKLCKQDHPGSSQVLPRQCGQQADASPGGCLWRWTGGLLQATGGSHHSSPRELLACSKPRGSDSFFPA